MINLLYTASDRPPTAIQTNLCLFMATLKIDNVLNLCREKQAGVYYCHLWLCKIKDGIHLNVGN